MQHYVPPSSEILGARLEIKSKLVTIANQQASEQWTRMLLLNNPWPLHRYFLIKLIRCWQWDPGLLSAAGRCTSNPVPLPEPVGIGELCHSTPSRVHGIADVAPEIWPKVNESSQTSRLGLGVLNDQRNLKDETICRNRALSLPPRTIKRNARSGLIAAIMLEI